MRIFTHSLIGLLALSFAVSIPTVSASRQARQKRPPAKPGGKPATGTSTPAESRILPKPAADPNRATPVELREALYTNEEFFGAQSLVPRPFAEAKTAISALQAKYPEDVRLLRYGASLDEKLGNFPAATEQMRKYATVRSNAPNALRRLAAFYHGRAMYADEARTLQLLAPVAYPDEREGIYQQIATLVKDHELTGFDLANFYKSLMATAPDDVRLAKQYVEQLVARNDASAALRALDELQPKYPGELQYFLKTKASIYETQNKRVEAEAVYGRAFDPLWPRAIVSDWYELQRRFGRYRAYRRELQNRFLKPSTVDFDTTSRLFNIYAYEANYGSALRVLNELEQRRQTSGWKREELETAAGMCLQIGGFDPASRFLYSLFTTEGLKPGSSERESTLGKMTGVLLDAETSGVGLSAEDISLYKDIARADQGPGFLNGVLSLILAGNNIPSEYNQANANAVGYFNRALAYRFYSALRQEFPDSKALPDLHVRLLRGFAKMGEYETVVKLADEYLQKYPDSPAAPQISIEAAEAEARLKRRPAERTRLIALLDKLGAARKPGEPLVPSSSKRWTFVPDESSTATTDQDESRRYEIFDPSEGKEESEGFDEYDYPTDYIGNRQTPPDRVTYASVLEKVIASYASEEKKTEEGDGEGEGKATKPAPTKPNETLKFLYGEVKKYPKEEGLYERMLNWLGQQSLVDEQLRVYTQAVRRFGNNTWYHRMGRWFVRNERKDAFARYSKELAETLDDGDLAEYLQRFADRINLNGDNNDAKLYLELFRFAHDRFPTNLFFVEGMLKYYDQTRNAAQWEQLSAQYYFADPSIRNDYLSRISKKSQLRGNFDIAKGKATAGYAQFAADAALWLSHHEEAVTAYEQLVKRYPGERYYAERLANVSRSLGARDVRSLERAAAVWTQLATIYPTDHTLPTQAGEVYAELGDFDRSRTSWDSILAPERGNPETYLEVASIYWDYYRYDEAIRTLQELRKRSGDSTAYAYQVGAILEGKNQMDAAIVEYVSALERVGGGREEAVRRLTQLAPRKDYGARIESAFNQRRGTRNSTDLVLGYVDYLKAANRTDDAVKLLVAETGARTELDFLESARSEFRSQNRPEEERRTTERLISLARDEREAIKYRLQLGSFFEQRNQNAEAVAIFDRLTADFPSNFGVIQESAQFYGRIGQLDKAIALQQRARESAVGDYKRQLTLQLARRQVEAAKYADAEATLRAWYKDNPTDNETFTLLAQVLGKGGRSDALVALYKEGLANLKQGADETGLRFGYIGVLTSLKQYTEATDQYIEVINRNPEDSGTLSSAMRFAAKYDQLPRLTKYYVDLAKKADRNFRWNVILAEIYRFQGNTIEAAGQYKLAVLNEPQRGDFRESLADLYIQGGRFDDALAVLKRAEELDPTNPGWLVRQAKLHLAKGDPTTAVATLRESIRKRKQVTPATYFESGKLLFEAGLLTEGLPFYEDGINRVLKNPGTESWRTDDISAWITAIAKTQSPMAALTRLETLESRLESELGRRDKVQNEHTKSILDGLGPIRSNQFAAYVKAYAYAEQIAELDQRLNQTLNGSNFESLPFNRAATLASAIGLYRSQETTLIKRKDAAFSKRTTDKDTQFKQALQNLTAFYLSRGELRKAVQVLDAEELRERFPGTFNYTEARVAAYQSMGDTEGELVQLEKYYRNLSGDLSQGDNQLVARYLSLLLARGDRAKLQGLAGTYSPYQLQLIKFLVVNGEKDLARAAIASAKLPQAWRDSRTAQLELYFRNTSPEVEKLFQGVLGIRPIGQQYKHRPDAATELNGFDWYRTARNYGIWLSLDEKRSKDVNDFLVAETEAAPRSDEAQRKLADFLLARKRYPEALAHIRLALEIDPDNYNSMALEGTVLFESGDRKGAMAAWSKMVEVKSSRMEAHVLYLAALSDHGLLSDALPAIEKYLTRQISKSEPDSTTFDAVLDALHQIAEESPEKGQLVSKSLLRVAASVPNDLYIAGAGVDLLPKALKPPFFELLLNRLGARVIASYSNGDFAFSDSSLNFGSISDSTPAQALTKVQQAWADYVLGGIPLTDAQAALKGIGAQRELLFGKMRETVSSDVTVYDTASIELEPEWLVMALAASETRSGQTPQAVTRLRKFLKLDGTAEPQPVLPASDEGEEEATPTAKDAHLHAYTLLVNEGKQAEADALLGEYYQQQLSEFDALADFVGAAEIEFRRGRTAEALNQLKRVVERFNNADGALMSAEIAARYGQYAPAIEWRQRATKLAPRNFDNQLELARLLDKTGDGAGAMKLLGDGLSDRTTGIPDRMGFIRQLAKTARRNQGLIGELAAKFQKEDVHSLTVRAVLADAQGNAAEARTLFQQASAIPYGVEARELFGEFLEAANQPAEAFTAYEAANREWFYPAYREDFARTLLAANRLDAAFQFASNLRSGKTGGEDSSEKELTFLNFQYLSVRSGISGPTVAYRSFNEEFRLTRKAAQVTLLRNLANAAAKNGNIDIALAFARRLLEEVDAPGDVTAADQLLAELNKRDAARPRREAKFGTSLTEDLSFAETVYGPIAQK